MRNDVRENDLGTVRGNVSLITSHPRHFLAQLTPHTRVVFVSQLLLFPMYNNISEIALSVNNSLKCHCAQLQTVNRNGKRVIDKKHYCCIRCDRATVMTCHLMDLVFSREVSE